MKKILVIEDSAKFIIFKNRKVRTPVSLPLANESELKALKIQMNMSDIQKWKVKDLSEKDSEVIDYDYEEPKEVVIEELEEPKTTLAKLIRDGESE